MTGASTPAIESDPPTRWRGRVALRPGLGIAFALFAMFGTSEVLAGSVWPTMRVDLGRPVSSLGWMVAGYTLGYLIAATGSGWFLEWFGVDRVLIAGVSATTAGLCGFVVSPWWWLVVASSFVTGVGGGTVDSTLNTFLTITAGARAMNLLHACFGVGATIAPLGATVALGIDASWRLVYAAVAVIETCILVVVIRRRRQFHLTVRPTDGDGFAGPPMPRPLLALVLIFFACYVAVEVSLGQWSYSLLVDQRGASSTVAGFVVAGYWAGLMAGRIALAVAGRRIDPESILRWSALATASGAAAFWFDPLPAVGLAALPFIGFAQAGMFPAMVLLNPSWLGPHNTGRAVGLQLMASGTGAIVSSTSIGAAVRQWDLEAMPIIVTGVACLTFVAFAGAERLASASATRASPMVS